MARLILGVTGSVAAIKTPDLYTSLIESGHAVRVVTTEPALAFFDPAAIGSRADNPGAIDGRVVFRDRDEWPAAGYRRGDLVPHIEFRRWAEMLIVAPLDANTLAKLALGISDNFLTCIFRAWDFTRPVVLAPAMNTLMWESPVTLRHFRQILEDRGVAPLPSGWTLEQAPEVFVRHASGIVLVAPQAKQLACGDVGLGAMAEVAAIAEVVRDWSTRLPGGGLE